MTVISLSKLSEAGGNDDMMCVLERMEKYHGKVAANKRKAWFYFRDWNHIFAKVVQNGHGDYALKIKDMKQFKKIYNPKKERDLDDEILDIGKFAIHYIREKRRKGQHS